MRRIITLAIFTIILCGFPGCTNKDNKDVSGSDLINTDVIYESSIDTEAEENQSVIVNSNNESNNMNDAVSVSSDDNLSELGELSKKLALQMKNGEFKETHNTLSLLVKLQITLGKLEQAWNDTVADMGNYKVIRKITEETVNDSTVVYVILDYDNSGIQVLFSYNDNKKLNGLWINYAPYDSEDVNDAFEDITISFGDSNSIEAILTLPKDVTNPPVIILVHGSGNHDADETIGVNKPFRDLAHGFARHGIAVIRYKESSNPMPEYTIQDDSLNDAAQAIKYATSCDKVDNDKIYIVGHSLGGMMAPKIAIDNKEVDGIVILGGSPRRLEDIILDQNKILLKEDDTITEAMYKLAVTQAELQVNKVKDIKEEGSEILLGYPASYWYSLNQIDIPNITKSLDIPIYIAQGSEDFQVYADIDYVAWQELLKDADKVTLRLYDNLNHLFMTSNGRKDVTEYNIKGTVDQQVIDDIAEWILN